jgi:peptidoglycan/LPS O-acetylase OafA/YrhL
MKYIKHLDGLRALAVILVILFHSGIEIFSGGYIGVDIFFVLSGYLITGIIVEKLKNNSFSFS